MDSKSDWNGWMLVSIMQQHRLQTQFRRVYKQSPFFDSEGIHQAIYIVAEHKVIFFSEERHQLLLKTAKRINSEIIFEKIPLSLDPSKSALLLDSSRLRTRSFSSSCVRMYGCGAEDPPWETCGSADAGGSGEPEVDSPSSSSSESMVNSFGGSGTEIPSPCGTGRMVYSDTLLPTSFSS